MPEEKRILEILAEKKINVEERERLLALTASEGVTENTGSAGIFAKQGVLKYLWVEVRSSSDTKSSP